MKHSIQKRRFIELYHVFIGAVTLKPSGGVSSHLAVTDIKLPLSSFPALSSSQTSKVDTALSGSESSVNEVISWPSQAIAAAVNAIVGPGYSGMLRRLTKSKLNHLHLSTRLDLLPN